MNSLTTAEDLAGKDLSVRTTGRDLLGVWNSVGSIDLTEGRKAELERLAAALAANGSVVIPAKTVQGLAAAPAGMAIGVLEIFGFIASAATLFALGFAVGDVAGEYVRGVIDDHRAVNASSDDSGDVKVEVEE